MNLFSVPQLARNANRLREVLTVLGRYGLADGISRLPLGFAKGLLRSSQGEKLATLTTAARVRLALGELGPTFIKLGQVLSTRADLIGPSLANELTALQGNAPADAFDVVRTIVERELGQPLTTLFARFDEQPLASASIGQVHAAWLPDGRAVVVKVQHPNIEQIVRTDLDILTGLAELAEQYLEEFRPYQPVATIEQFERTIRRELDFNRERRHLELFSRHFAHNPNVRFPVPVASLCSSRVLTMDRLDGVRLNDPGLDLLGVDREAVARCGAGMFLEMIFRDGFYHADPHPGNLLILPGGVLGVLDCGMVGRLDEPTREAITALMLALLGQDAEQMTAVLRRLGALPLTADTDAFQTDLSDFLAYYAHQPLARFDLSAALSELMEMIRRHGIVLPPPLALLLKVLVMLEGTGRLLHPQFNLAELIRPYQRAMLRRHLSPFRQLRKLRAVSAEWAFLIELLPRTLLSLLRRGQTGRPELTLEHKGLEPSVNRLVLALLTASLFLGSALLAGLKMPPLLGDAYSIPGILGGLTSLGMGLRLFWAIRQSGRL